MNKNKPVKEKQLLTENKHYLRFMRVFYKVSVFFLGILWLHFFERLTYAGREIDFYNVISFLTLSVGCWFMIDLYLLKAPLWRKIVLYAFLSLMGINILLGFLNKYYQRDSGFFSPKESTAIRHYWYNQDFDPMQESIRVLRFTD